MSKLPIPFDNPATYKGHSGVDFGQPRGTPFRASGPGRVSSRSKNVRGGYYVWVQYDAGPLVSYHHMDSHRGVPAVGTRVSEGTLLGYVGSLGQYSTGPHLHSEVSGYATSTGYWKFFDPDRVVGEGSATSSPASSTRPLETLEDDMKLLYVTDNADGNRKPGWVLLNTRTGGLIPMVNDGTEVAQSRANSWAAVWGKAKKCVRQDMLNAVAAIQQTS